MDKLIAKAMRGMKIMIAIKEMDMPANCGECRFKFYTDDNCNQAKCIITENDIKDETVLSNHCPLIEIKGYEETVKFISYDGAYPNLCRGTLVLEFEGVRYEIEDCLLSGGRVWFDVDWKEYVEEGLWSVDDDKLPEILKPYAKYIECLVNENVPLGCCGGCI